MNATTNPTPIPEIAKDAEMTAEKPEIAEDIFTKAARVREDRAANGPQVKIVRKPMNLPVILKCKAWFRTHPDAVFRGLPIFTDPSSEEMEAAPYFVAPDLLNELEGSEGLLFYTGYLVCTAAGKNMLLLVKEADFDGKMHSATESKHEACLIVEPIAADKLEDNLNPVGRLFYSASTMVCVPTSLAQEVGAALGAQAGEASLSAVIAEGGFTKIRRATETPFNMILEARV